MVLISHVILQNHVTEALLTLLKVGHHPSESGCHKHPGSRDVMVLVFHAILKDHMIKALCHFMDRSPLRLVKI